MKIYFNKEKNFMIFESKTVHTWLIKELTKRNVLWEEIVAKIFRIKEE